jgi:CheY-like chemotaxis protein
MPKDHRTTLLLVEDDPGHARLIECNLQRAHLPYTIVLLPDGQAAIDYLFPTQQASGTNHRESCLVLLDLNLPGCHGVDILTRLKCDARTKHIPVIVLTTTDGPHEIEQCYALGCNAYLTKPVEYDQFVAVLQHLGWLLMAIAVPIGAAA